MNSILRKVPDPGSIGLKLNKIWDLKASQGWKIVVGTAVGDNVAAAVDKGGVAVDIVVDVLYALHRVLSLLRLADPPLFSLLGHVNKINKKLSISLIIIIYRNRIRQCCESTFIETGSG